MQPFNPLDGEPSWFDNTRNVRRTSSNIIDLGIPVDNPFPAVEPITLAQAKAHIRVDFGDDDSYITELITEARQVVENYCCISITPKNWSITLDLIADVEIPFGPNISNPVLTDSDGNTVDTTMYKVIGSGYAKIYPLGFWWFGATLTYTAGFAAVPAALQRGILEQLAFMYESRGDAADQRRGVNPGVAEQARVTIESYRRYAWL